MLNAHIGAIYLQNTENIQKREYLDGFCLQGELDLTLFVCLGCLEVSHMSTGLICT